MNKIVARGARTSLGPGAAMSTEVPSILLPRDPDHEFVRVMAHPTVEKRTEDYDDALALPRSGRVAVRGRDQGRGSPGRTADPPSGDDDDATLVPARPAHALRQL